MKINEFIGDRKSLEERVIDNTYNDSNGCWVWMLVIKDDGYGRISIRGKSWLAHRASYEILKGKIPDGLVLDHLCKNKSCVNPNHLEPVTSRDNLIRSGSVVAKYATATCCKNGHPFSIENTLFSRQRTCRKCNVIRNRKYRVSKMLCEKYGAAT